MGNTLLYEFLIWAGSRNYDDLDTEEDRDVLTDPDMYKVVESGASILSETIHLSKKSSVI